MRRFARRAIVAIVLLGLLGVVCACAEKTPDSGATGSPGASQIRISGAGSAIPLIRLLTEHYPDRAETKFVILPGVHSVSGIAGVREGDLEIGALSGDPEDQKLQGLEYVALSDDGMVFATHPSVTLEGLECEQVVGVYAGEYSNWKELGGPDLPIVVLDREEDQTAKRTMREYVLKETSVTCDAVVLFYEQDVVDALEKTPGAVGFCSLGLVTSEQRAIHPLALNGVHASIATVEDGSYPVVRRLGMVIDENASPETKRFAEWAQGPEAREVLKEAGFAAVAPER